MDLAEYASCDGIALADFVRKRKISHRELAHLFADAVEKVNPKINAVIEMYSDRIDAIDDHPALTAPLGGVPFLMKDVGASESGRRQEMGSMLMKGHVADKDSFLTGFFKRAGLALLGRTTTPEFAMGISTESRLTGMTRNPWNLDLMAGGSSGGAAASVAAGIVPLAHGSDNGGSIRIPASVCGLVGLKPSRGRVSLGPDFADPGMLQEFVLTKSVRDTALMLDAVSQPVLGDPYIIIQPRRPYAQEVNSQVEKLRIAWTLDSWKPGNSVDSEVSQCMEEVISECGKAGHDLAEKSPVFDYEEYLHALCAAWAFANYAGIDMCASGEGRTVTEENVEPVMLSFYNYSKGLTGADIMLSEFVLNKFRRIFGKFFEQYDILLTPTLNKLPEPLGKYAIKRTDVDYVGYMRLCDETRIHTTAANVTGQPAITLPLGRSQSGLPIGVQLIARFGEEDKLIQLASSLESTMPWRDRVPSVHASR